MLGCLEPKCACFLFAGLLWRKGEDRPDRNREQAVQPNSCEQLCAHLNMTSWPERKIDDIQSAKESNLPSATRTAKGCLSTVLYVPATLRSPHVSEAACILVHFYWPLSKHLLRYQNISQLTEHSYRDFCFTAIFAQEGKFWLPSLPVNLCPFYQCEAINFNWATPDLSFLIQGKK